MASMNTVPVIPEARRCAGCGIDLRGKVSYPILHLHSCPTVHCMSRVYIENIQKLEPSERERVGRKIQDAQYQEMRHYHMAKVYVEHTTL